MPTVLKVRNPIGRVEVTQMPAPRLADLHGKKVGMLWNGVFRGQEILPYLRGLLRGRFPDADVHRYDELPIRPGPETIGQMGKQKGFDAVISGCGG